MICPHCNARINARTKRSMLVDRIGRHRRNGAITPRCAKEAKDALLLLLSHGAKAPISLETTKQHGLVATWWAQCAEVASIWITARGHTHVHIGPAWVQRQDWLNVVLHQMEKAGMTRVPTGH